MCRSVLCEKIRSKCLHQQAEYLLFTVLFSCSHLRYKSLYIYFGIITCPYIFLSDPSLAPSEEHLLNLALIELTLPTLNTSSSSSRVFRRNEWDRKIPWKKKTCRYYSNPKLYSLPEDFAMIPRSHCY